MTTNKRFVIRLLACFVAFLLVNWGIWKCWTEVILSPKYEGGDLTRLGFIAGIKKIRTTRTDLPKRHIEAREYHGQRVDMVTVGDSFSIGGGDGRNKYYQDYIASLSGISVLNVPTYKFDTMVCGAMPVSTIAALYHAGWLDRIKPRYLLLETVERYAIPRLVTNYTFDIKVPSATLEQYYRTVNFDGPVNQNISFINEGNFKFLYYTLMYQFSEHAFRRLVVKTRLTKPLFSGRYGDILLFHGDDVQQEPLATPENIRIANENLNTMARLLRKKGIELVFMPVVDKLDLYRPYMKNNAYPRSTFFEELRKLPREYRLIDTKAILSKALDEGKLDIFHQDDTHWTWRASQLIFSTERFARPQSGKK